MVAGICAVCGVSHAAAIVVATGSIVDRKVVQVGRARPVVGGGETPFLARQSLGIAASVLCVIPSVRVLPSKRHVANVLATLIAILP